MSDIHFAHIPPGSGSAGRILAMLKILAPGFAPPLNHQLDLSAYATKLAGLAEVIVAVDRATDVGVAAFYANDRAKKRAFLTMLGVVPARRDEGTGARLLLRAMEVAQTRGMQVFRLEVAHDNQRARDFYAKFGFVPVPARCSTPQNQNNALLMERPCFQLPPQTQSM